jgi:peptidoglycan/xylan/chitin deacetylase (PgdA/CDA1 family)
VIKKAVKCAVLAATRSSGIFASFLDSRWRQSRLAILCYHCLSIDDEHLWAPALFMNPALFESRLRMLKEGGYNVLPLAEAVDRLYQGSLPPRSVAITFDDGTCDFHGIALPLLRQYGLPATVYLTTYYSGRPHPVTPIFYDYLLWKGRAAYRGGPLPELENGIDIHNAELRLQTLSKLNERWLRENWTLTDRDEYGRKLGAAVGVDYDALAAKRILQIMTPSEAKDVAAAGGIDIQLHTHRHRTPRDRDLFLREIDDNRAAIGQLDGSNPDHFCYPSGVVHKDFLPWLRERGVRTATTCISGLASTSDDPLLLPRVTDTCLLRQVELESWLCGLSAWVRPHKPAVLHQLQTSREQSRG